MNGYIDVVRAYEQGRTTFLGVELLIAPGALVPRPETELLGSAAVKALLRMNRSAPRIIDMCCGSGNLACAIARLIPQAHVWASDLTDDCVAVARRNVEHLHLADRIIVTQGDGFEALQNLGLNGTIDAVVCNPPYISEKRLHGDRAHLLAFEPREAFAAGPYGLSIHMRVAKDAAQYLRPGGALLLEIGLGQERQVMRLLERVDAYENIHAITNDAGEPRVVVGEMKA